MDTNKGLEWVKEKIDKGRDEVVRLTRVSKLRIEISSLSKKKEDRLLAMGKRVFQLIEEGKISETYFEPDYSGTLQIDDNIEKLIDEIEEINAMSAESEDLVETVLVEEELNADSADETLIESEDAVTTEEDETPVEPIEEVAEQQDDEFETMTDESTVEVEAEADADTEDDAEKVSEEGEKK